MNKEQEYFNLLGRLTKGAEMIDNPYLDKKKKKEYKRLYDEIEKEVLRLKGMI